MKKNGSLIWKIGALVVLIGIAVVMFIIGRGHTVYFDNKPFEYEGQENPALYKVAYIVNGNDLGYYKEKERASATTIGQHFSFDMKVQKTQDSSKEEMHVELNLPYNLDGIVINIPALLAGCPEEVYQSEFVSLATVVEDSSDEEVVTDEFAIGGDF